MSSCHVVDVRNTYLPLFVSWVSQLCRILILFIRSTLRTRWKSLKSANAMWIVLESRMMLQPKCSIAYLKVTKKSKNWISLNRYMFRRIIGGDEKCCAQETWLVLLASGASFSTTRWQIGSPGRWYSSHFIYLNIRG